MTEAILMTGATGFLGTEMVAELVRTTKYQIYVLVRAENEEAAYYRLKSAWFHDKDLLDAVNTQVFPVIGDFMKPGLGLSSKEMEMLKERITILFHSGAQIGLQKEEKEINATNIEGTKNVIDFAKELPELKRFVHISTAYVAGQQMGQILEEGPIGKLFSSIYERSKAQAEKLVRGSGLAYTICRPGMIVGHSVSGRVKNFNTIYYVLKLMLTGKMRVLPVKKDMGLNLVPVDYVAKAAVKAGLLAEAEGKTFHLTCPKDLQPKAKELVDYLCDWAEANLLLHVPKPIYAPMSALKKAGLSYNQKGEGRKKNLVTNLLTLLPYFYGGQDFDRTNTDSLLGRYELNWRDYIDPLLDFACRKNFMQQTERTVFEQARVRRESKHYPITYYNITKDSIRRISGEKANRRIRLIVNAMWAWGIRKGDKIALTGINSIDYMTLDQAIGLIGAVSVPIYYTTPIEETKMLLERSGAKWFFVGDKRMMSQMDEFLSDIPVVAFSAGLEVAKKGVMTWSAFLAKGKKKAPVVYVDPEDLATIRYTSGTTGEPKGVMFNYYQLSWMGEVLTNLLSWKGRNRTMRYMSFLPQSHVVEGILASYAPYYMLTKIDYYYLNDFGSLVEALPKVRPTVFFSVPRFYEKLWDQLAANEMGKKYLALPKGPAKKALAMVLKKVILKKAGLDACEQLIVGSAPISQVLLQNFRDLGIEIHNAYGQTEAPLITINRMRDNVIPTMIVEKTKADKIRMKGAIEQCRVILDKLGVPRNQQFLGTLNAGHPGGMLPLTEAEKDSLHNPSLPDNLYVADGTILPKSFGNPPILTIMALAKRIAKIV